MMITRMLILTMMTMIVMIITMTAHIFVDVVIAGGAGRAACSGGCGFIHVDTGDDVDSFYLNVAMKAMRASLWPLLRP